jgi:hypothetical protein
LKPPLFKIYFFMAKCVKCRAEKKTVLHRIFQLVVQFVLFSLFLQRIKNGRGSYNFEKDEKELLQLLRIPPTRPEL